MSKLSMRLARKLSSSMFHSSLSRYFNSSGSVISVTMTTGSFSGMPGTNCVSTGRVSVCSSTLILIFKLIMLLLSAFYDFFHIFREGGPRVLIATAPLQFAFSFGIIQAVVAVAIFFFVLVGDLGYLLSLKKLNLLRSIIRSLYLSSPTESLPS